MSDYWPNRVAIGDFLADNDTTGDFRITAKVSGWGSAPIRLEMEDKSQQDGGWDAMPLLGPRPITVEGMVDLATHADAQAVSDGLTSLPRASLIQFTVDNDAIGPRSAMVRVEIGADPEWLTPECFTYTLQLRAPDPLKYGPATFGSTTLAASAGGTGRVWPRVWPRDWGVPPGVTPGAVSVPNAGTAAYFPRIWIDGFVSNPVVTLVETGDTVRFNGNVGAGQFLEIDCARRRVLLGAPSNPAGAVSQRHKVSFTGNWLGIPMGGGSVSWSADSFDSNHGMSVFGVEGAWS